MLSWCSISSILVLECSAHMGFKWVPNIVGLTHKLYIYDFSNLLQSLKFLFSVAKSFNFFFIAMQGWVGRNVHKTLSMSLALPYFIT